MNLNILLITYYFPPANTVASHRIYSFAKYLPEFGINVDVFTPKRDGNLSYDLRNINIIHTNKEITAVNKFADKKNILKELFKNTGIRPILYYFNNKFYREGMRLLTKEMMMKFDAIFVSFGPANVLRLAYYLKRKYNLPLIIDIRDIWTEILYFDPKKLDRLFIYLIEKRILNAASLIIATSKNNAQKISNKYNNDVITIYNGFFDDEMINSNFCIHDNDSKFLKIAYCGSLYNGVQPIEMIFPILAQHENIKLHIAVLDKIDTMYILNLINKYKVAGKVHLYENLTNNDSLQLQKYCDILLFLNRIDGVYNGIIAVKLFEYMTAKKFVLGIGNKDDEAALIIHELGIGAYADSVDKAREIILKAHYWKTNDNPQINFFSRRHQAKILADEIIRVMT